MPTKRQPMTLRIGDEFNPEGRCGEPKKAHGRRYLHVWFTSGTFKSYASDELMDKLIEAKIVRKGTSNEAVLYERVRFVYYEHATGLFYRPLSHKNQQRLGDAYQFTPVEGEIWTAYPSYQTKNGLADCTIRCSGGMPTSILMGDDCFTVDRDSWPVMESFLGLDESYKPERYRPEWACNYIPKGA